MNEQQEPDFPIVDQIKISNFIVESMFLEAKRLVIVRQAMLQKRVYSPTEIQCRDDDRSRRGAHGKWDTIVRGR